MTKLTDSGWEISFLVFVRDLLSYIIVQLGHLSTFGSPENTLLVVKNRFRKIWFRFLNRRGSPISVIIQGFCPISWSKECHKKIRIGVELWTVKDFSSQKVDFAKKTITYCQKLVRGHGYYGLCSRLLSTDPKKKIWKILKIVTCERFWNDPLVRPEPP